MSEYGWDLDYEDVDARDRAWEQADRDEHAELVARDRLTRDVGEVTERVTTGGRVDSHEASPRSVTSPTMLEAE